MGWYNPPTICNNMAQTIPTSTAPSSTPLVAKALEAKKEIEFIPLTNINKDRLSPISYLPRPAGSRISLRNTHGAQSSTETSGIGTALSSFDMSFEFDQDQERSPRTPERDRRRVSPRRADSFEHQEFRRRRSPPKRGDSCELPSRRSGSPTIGPPEFLNQHRDHTRQNRRHSPEAPDIFRSTKPAIFEIPSAEEQQGEGRRGSKDSGSRTKKPELKRTLSKEDKERSQSLERRCPGRGTPDRNTTPDNERVPYWARGSPGNSRIMSPEGSIREPRTRTPMSDRSDRFDSRRVDSPNMEYGSSDRFRTDSPSRRDQNPDYRREHRDQNPDFVSGPMDRENPDYSRERKPDDFRREPIRDQNPDFRRDPRNNPDPRNRDNPRDSRTDPQNPRRTDSPSRGRGDSRHASTMRRTEPPRNPSEAGFHEPRPERRSRPRAEPGESAAAGSRAERDSSDRPVRTDSVRPHRAARGATSYAEDTIEPFPENRNYQDTKYSQDYSQDLYPDKNKDKTSFRDSYGKEIYNNSSNNDYPRDSSRFSNTSEYREARNTTSAYPPSAFSKDRDSSAYDSDIVQLRNRDRNSKHEENRDSGFFRDFDAEMSDNRGYLNVDGEQRNDPNDLIDYGEFNKRRGSRTPSPCPSPRLSRSGSTRGSRRKSFLGIETNSTWVKWSQARRNSFQNRIKQIEQHEKIREQSKAKLPIKKARMESSRFLNPDEEPQSDEEVIPKPKKKKSKAKKDKNEPVQPKPRKKIRLTEKQWQILIDFWENPSFVRSRIFGILFSLVAVILGCVALATDTWSEFTAADGRETARMGIFFHCDTANITQGTVIKFASLECETLIKYTWQKAVIGLFIFAVSFGFLATILSVCGICVNNLPRKLYYYHSAGEIFFVCAIACTFSLVAYPILIEKENLPRHNYGYSYIVAWTATAFFYASCFCMMLDDIVHAVATRGCLCCCKRAKPNDGSQSV